MKKRKTVSPELILLVVVGIYCLAVPNSDWWDGKVISFFLLTIKLYFMQPFWWGILCFYLLRNKNVRAAEYKEKLYSEKKMIIIIARITAIVLVVALCYWTCGFCCYAVLAPMPFEWGYYIMNNRSILGIGWCIAAVAVYFSFQGSRCVKK